MTLPSGAAFIDIALEQVDKKSPVDDVLMTSIDEDLYYLKGLAEAASNSGGVFEFKLNGNLEQVRNSLPLRRIDGAFVMKATVLSSHAVYLEIAGRSGTLEVDLRKYRATNTPIDSIANQFEASINSVTRAGSSSATQSISRSTPQVSTQSVSFYKTQLNVQSIVPLTDGRTRYNLDAAPDADYDVNDWEKFASCTAGANNGVFQIVEVNQDGGFNLVVLNSVGVAQTAPAGTADLQAFSYDLVNPADTEFSVGEKALFASHTSALNDGSFTLFAVNATGNQLVVKNKVGVTQGGVAGNCNVLRFKYAFSSAAPSDLVVGETTIMASHTSGVNDGNLLLTAVNSGGNNVIVYNATGATQGGVAGSVNSNRWIYALPSDPSSDFNVGENAYITATTSAGNSGGFDVRQINRLASNNLVFFNESGVTQGGAAGNLISTRKLVKFVADESATYSTKSRVGIRGTADLAYTRGEFEVLEVNRGGGANFNIVIEVLVAASQVSPSGRVMFESRSVFSTLPIFTVTANDLNLIVIQNGVLDSTEKTIAAGRLLALDILQIPIGAPMNLTVHAS